MQLKADLHDGKESIMTIFKKSVSYILIMACLLSANSVFADTSFTAGAIEIDQSGEVYSFTENFTRDASLVDTTKTGTGVTLDLNWASKASGSMDGNGTTGITTFGFDGQDLKVGIYKQDDYPKISASQVTKMAGINWTTPHPDLTSKFVLKTAVRKSHNVNMWGVRFMQHNNEQNYYMLFLGGQYTYQISTNQHLAWGLYKVENGAVTILAEQLDSTFIGTASDAELTLTYDNGKISFNVAYNGNENYYSGAYTDEDPYILTGNDSTVQLVASSCGGSVYPIYFRNFSIANYTPYITGGEPENVIYNDVVRYAKFSANNVVDFYRAYPIRKIISSALSGATKDIYLSQDGTLWDKVTGASFNSNGVWLNNKSQKAYRYLYFDSLNHNDLKVYTDISGDYIYEAVVTDVIDLTAIYGGVENSSAYEWSVNNNTMATVTNGVITILRRKGNVEITATKGDLSHKAEFNIIGELEMATRNNTVEQYISEKKPVIDAINTSISTRSFNDFKAIMKDEGTIKIGSIVDLDTTKVSSLDDDKLLAMFTRLSTYEPFKCFEPKDLSDFSKILDNEYAVGQMCGISTDLDFETAFDINNEYIGIDTEGFYFENYKNDVFSKLLNIQFTNYNNFISLYNEAMISVSYEKALSYVMVQNFIDFFDSVIGYNKTHYDEEKGDDLYEKLLEEKENLDTIAKLKDYIDKYEKPETPTVVPPEEDDDDNGGYVSGGGGGGGGGIKTVYQIEDEKEPVLPPEKKEPVIVVAFSDVDSEHWAYKSIVMLKNSNVINGYEDGCFYPENNITRAEFVKILVSALKLELKEAKSAFVDVDDDDWFAPYVITAKENGLVEGDGENFNAESNISRQEMAVMIYRALDDLSTDDIQDTEFSDIADVAPWARDAVEYLKKQNIITGYENMFNPLDFATRAEVAQLISKIVD